MHPKTSSGKSKRAKKGFTKLENAFSLFDELEGKTDEELNMSMSSKSVELGESLGWLANFGESDSRSDFQEVKSEPWTNGMSSRSRQSIERDALRKYVRKRYLKSNSAPSGR